MCTRELLADISSGLPAGARDALLPPAARESPLSHTVRRPRWAPTKPQDPPKRKLCSLESLVAPRVRHRLHAGQILGVYTAVDRCLKSTPKSPRESNRWRSRDERVPREHESDLRGHDEPVVRWRKPPSCRVRFAEGELKFEKMMTWLRKRGKDDSAIFTDLTWLRMLRGWFASIEVDERGALSVDDVQCALASVGVGSVHDEVKRELEARSLGRGSDFADFVEFVLDVDREGVSRLAAQHWTSQRHRPPPPSVGFGSTVLSHRARAVAEKSLRTADALLPSGAPSSLGYARQRQLSAVVERLSDLDRLSAARRVEGVGGTRRN